MAGLSKTSPKKFLIFDLLGEIIYVLIFSGLGYAFSDEWRMISSLAGDITSVLVLILVFVVLLAVFLLKKQNTRKKRVFPVFKKQSSGLI
jgi:membrane protein DedA with SNARE-associated domain